MRKAFVFDKMRINVCMQVVLRAVAVINIGQGPNEYFIDFQDQQLVECLATF